MTEIFFLVRKPGEFNEIPNRRSDKIRGNDALKKTPRWRIAEWSAN